MKTVSILAIAGIATAASAQWYNGDPDLVNGLAAEMNTAVGDSLIFEDFDHGGGTITDVWGNYFIDFQAVGYVYEIRSGISNGFGGTLHASGDTDGAFSQSPNGFDNFGFIGQTVAADIADVNLGAGTYFLALSPKGSGSGRSFVQTTSHANGYGSPLDAGGYWHSGTFGVNYLPISQGFGVDYAVSYGVNVPAPASAALLGLGALVARRRR